MRGFFRNACYGLQACCPQRTRREWRRTGNERAVKEETDRAVAKRGLVRASSKCSTEGTQAV
jgi:hypothetical protein